MKSWNQVILVYKEGFVHNNLYTYMNAAHIGGCN
jgi:hypothetical protein